MQEIVGSVRRSLVFRTPNTPTDGDYINSTVGGFINSCIRKSRVFSRPSPPPLPSPPLPIPNENPAPVIRWRKGELIGCGAFGRVYMGMNLDSGELLAVKQVLIAANTASKEKAQAHIRELEEEVKLLKNHSHPNIVRYLGTVREEDSLNILLEFVSGGSISSLLGKFGAFPEAVIRMYTKQLLLGLEYLHNNGIMHRDIKGANILVDNKGCIKLADFGASKQVVELATVSGAKSMKGTPYWMAPEVILQTGHNFSADVWSVGCTVIEMATGKPPWSQQYQEVAALFHIGTTKSHPPIPEHLSVEAKDFLLKCLQKEPNLRPAASELLQHPFVTGERIESNPVFCPPEMENSGTPSPICAKNLETYKMSTDYGSTDVCNLGSVSCSTGYPEKKSKGTHCWRTNISEDDMCQIDDKDDSVVGEVKFSSILMPDDFNKSFNPMCEPSDDWRCKFDESPELEQTGVKLNIDQPDYMPAGCTGVFGEGDNCGQSLYDDDDELTESKIRAFLDEKALELKKLQTPLYEEFHNSILAASSPNFSKSVHDEVAPNYLKLPPKSRSPSSGPIGTPSTAVDALHTASPGSNGRQASNISNASDQTSQDISSTLLNDRKGLVVDAQQESNSPSVSFFERQRKWKEELDQELERGREMKRQAGQQTSSPKDVALNRKRECSRFASPGT